MKLLRLASAATVAQRAQPVGPHRAVCTLFTLILCMDCMIASAAVPSASVEGARSWLHKIRQTRVEQEHHGPKHEAPPLSFAQLGSDMHAKALAGGPLFSVIPNMDWEEHDSTKGATVMHIPGTQSLKLEPGLDPSKGLAWGRLADNLEKTGWIELWVETTTSGGVSNDVRMYAAGLYEGYVTARRMSQFYSNAFQLMLRDTLAKKSLANVRDMFKDELSFMMKNTNFGGVEPTDPYWKHARYLLTQLYGIKDGYNFVALAKGVRQIDMIDMFVINSHAEMPELVEAYNPGTIVERAKFQEQIIKNLRNAFLQTEKSPGQKSDVHPHSASLGLLRGTKPNEAEVPNATVNDEKEAGRIKSLMKQEGMDNYTQWLADQDWEKRLIKHGHCTAFVRLSAQNKDLLVGHTTWSDYSKMTRIFKYYNFDLPGSFSHANHIGFSSYPGCVSSTDDWYMLSSGLLVTETSLEILNPSLYDRIPDFPANSHLPNFLHIMICNRMAKTGAHWTSLFSERNSGTNNAQWIIVDYNRFEPEQYLPDNTLFILEQIPGLIHMADLSGYLRMHGYWASYDRPFFEEVRSMSGHDLAEKTYGALYSYEDGPRATIFKHLGSAIKTLFDMRSIMNRNVYPNEGVLPNSPGHAVSARNDLDSVSHLPNGGIDAKVTNRCLFRSMQTQAISGPTHDNQAVFKWRDTGGDVFPGWPHMGLPDVWDFKWVQMTPTTSLHRVVDQTTC